MHKRSTEAQRLLDKLDGELAVSAQQRGVSLSWTAAEREHLGMIANTVDRRVRLAELFAQCDPDDVKNRIRLSTEIRQCDNLVSRLLAKVKTDVPASESRRTQKARAAARARWDHAAS
ncbi:hypothetical protein [Mycobacterium riyadhense]|uniref:hypothetical protein n=1 Tax=Mycobacterium riyadhense TaxID=486698 RepID=UPI001958560E|nr:hypothetical protein [Mycobacterium riyadhense]